MTQRYLKDFGAFVRYNFDLLVQYNLFYFLSHLGTNGQCCEQCIGPFGAQDKTRL